MRLSPLSVTVPPHVVVATIGVRITALPVRSTPVPPETPLNDVAVVLVYVSVCVPVLVTTRIVPEAAKPVVLATSIVVNGSATPSEPAATVVAVDPMR